jgi:methyl-accepting chemotaxis protein
MLKVLKDFHHGNYRTEVDESIFRGGVLKDVIHEINYLGKLLQELSSKQQGILDESSATLAKMVAELANSSNEQALSIEQIAAAVDEISANIQQTSEKSSNIQNISKESFESSQNGNVLAEDTLNAMIKINESTNAIASAIEMIDQIAFQTNILSLNAAVEAATAGEAGKGFAVVAGEVRNLATRSTEVAKEIKELVVKAQSETEVGNSIVKDMSEAFANLNQKIDQTTKLIDDVTVATREQHLGIEQISDSMNSLDNMTNHNRDIVNSIQNVSKNISEMAKDLG